MKIDYGNEFMKYGFDEFIEKDDKMKFKVGDKVRVREWVDMEDEFEEKTPYGSIQLTVDSFTIKMGKHCGSIVTISNINGKFYKIKEDYELYYWTDEMFEDKVVVDKRIDVDKLYTTIENQQNEIEELEDKLKSAKETISKYFDEIAKYTEIEYTLDKRIKQLENELLDYYIAEIPDMTVTPEGIEYLEDDILDLIEKEIDVVNHPKHYTFGEIEVIDAIEDWDLPYHLGNVVKYVARAKHKGKELEDLRKAQFYMNRYVKLKEDEEGEKYCEEID